MHFLDIDNKRYVIRKRFNSSRIKDLNLLQEIKHFYQADTIVLDKTNNLTILVESVIEPEILEETINEQTAIYQPEG